tara:strand:+ start:79 stop:936 length:858 start_codon:yes stop_codon:yes gene_type:complete
MIDKNIISVIGSGTMGNGIAHVFALSEKVGNVYLVDLDIDILEKAKSLIERNLQRQVQKNIISDLIAKNALNKIICTTDIEKISTSDLIIEAVKEDINVKKTVFNQLDELAKDDAILATNTSSISIDKIANSINKNENVIGMHFMNPVPVMKLVEIIKGSKTSDRIVRRTLDYVNLINKIPIECNDSPGFVSNRILMPMINEAAFTLMEGVAEAEAIDGIMKLGMGHPMGPLKLADLIGIDVCVSIMKVLFEGFDNSKYKVCPLLEEMQKSNKLGVKTKEGFYKY